MITYEKFSVSPMKVRTLFVKKLLNKMNYNLKEDFYEDKQYKKALKHYQVSNGFAGNCIISHDVFYHLINNVHDANSIWNTIL